MIAPVSSRLECLYIFLNWKAMDTKMTKDYPVALMVGVDAEAVSEMPVKRLCQRGRCCVLKGISLVPVQHGKASDLMKQDETSCPHSPTDVLP